MTTTEKQAAAAADRFQIAQSRTAAAVANGPRLSAALVAAEQGRSAAQAALDALADAKVTGEPPAEETVQAAILELETAERGVRWAATVAEAGKRERAAAQAELSQALGARDAATEAARREAVRNRAIELATGRAA